MKVKYDNKWYDVLDTRKYFGTIFYAIAKNVNVKWIINPENIEN